MTLAPVPTPLAYAPAVARAFALFEAAILLDVRDDAIDKGVIDLVIEHHASLGLPFSANNLREDLPPVRNALISRRLIAAQNRGLIVKTGYTPSTLASTHGAVVAVYTPTDTG